MATLDPFAVRFSQSSILGTFRDGGTIEELAEGLRSGAVEPGSIPPIRIFERGGLWFTLDNRRLEAFRRAGPSPIDWPRRMRSGTKVGSSPPRTRARPFASGDMATVNSNPRDQVDAIRSRSDLVAFVRDLAHEARTRPDDWENSTLDTYLEALASWVEDCDGYYRNRGEIPPEQPSWRTLAEILAAASVYE